MSEPTLLSDTASYECTVSCHPVFKDIKITGDNPFQAVVLAIQALDTMVRILTREGVWKDESGRVVDALL